MNRTGEATARRFDGMNRYRVRGTATILEDVECGLWDLCEVDAAEEAGWLSPEIADNSRALLRLWLAEAREELERRQWLRDHPLAPSWPDRPAATRDDRSCPRRPDLARLKASADLVAIVERFAGVELRRVGKEWIGRCPFPDHPDRTPSFRVNQEKGVFYCHGCHRGGDVVTALMQFGCFDRFADALAWLENEVGESASRQDGKPGRTTRSLDFARDDDGASPRQLDPTCRLADVVIPNGVRNRCSSRSA